MKKYVFLVPTVAGMGGAQMYIRNKILYLRQNGWTVDIIVAQKGHAKLSELQDFRFEIPELAFEIFNYSNRKKKLIIDKIVSRINNSEPDEIIVESTCISEASWGEAIAKRLWAKHIVYLLQEDNRLNNKGLRQFFLFKHARKELIGITEQSLTTMFASFNPIPTEQSYWLPAYCNNVEADVDSPYIGQMDSIKHDYAIGLLSRLEKPFVQPAITDFCNYSHNHQEKSFLLVLMGDSPKGSGVLERLRKQIGTRAPNVRVISTGYLYPVPTKLLEKFDVFLTSAGSGWTCMRSGVPTITYDGNDLKPIGILGRTTSNALFRDKDEEPQDFSLLMEQILVEKKYKKETPNYAEGLPDFGDYIEFLDKTSKEKEYYDVETIMPETKTDFKLKFALAVFGPQTYLKLGFLKNKWIKS